MKCTDINLSHAGPTEIAYTFFVLLFHTSVVNNQSADGYNLLLTRSRELRKK